MYNLYIYDYANALSETKEETLRQALAQDIEDSGLTDSIYDIVCATDTEGDTELYIYTKDTEADERSLKLSNALEVIPFKSITFVKGRSML